jgi:hypothetical protein
MPRERKRSIAEDCKQLVVGQVPAPGERACLRWPDGASVTLERHDEAITIRYRWHTPARSAEGQGEAWHLTTQTVRLEADTPYLGGSRFYLACPGCGRRARKLYDATDGRFTCRRCGGLANRCQSEGAWVRALKRARKLRLYLGAEGGVGNSLPSRPKGMRRRTYQALCAEVQVLEGIPLEAWLSDGRNVKLNVRRSRMSASTRRWWPARNGWSKPGRSSR